MLAPKEELLGFAELWSLDIFSLRIDSDMLVVTASPARTALKISQMTDGGMPLLMTRCTSLF
jgi:hypothetical protein